MEQTLRIIPSAPNHPLHGSAHTHALHNGSSRAAGVAPAATNNTARSRSLVLACTSRLRRGAYTNHTTITASLVPPCLPDQALALVQLKQSFSVTNYSTMPFRSWRLGTDCCGWEGVHCDHSNSNDGRRVTSLDLGDCGLLSGGLSPALFKLTSLRYLNLGGNSFNGSQLPAAGFERLTELTHLNLSSSSFSGEIPTGIGSLRNLVSLDLSAAFDILDLADDGYSFNYAGNWLVEPNLARLIANLSSLLELRAGFVNLSNNPATEWCNALANYTPNLQVLSLPFCQLQGQSVLHCLA